MNNFYRKFLGEQQSPVPAAVAPAPAPAPAAVAPSAPAPATPKVESRPASGRAAFGSRPVREAVAAPAPAAAPAVAAPAAAPVPAAAPAAPATPVLAAVGGRVTESHSKITPAAGSAAAADAASYKGFGASLMGAPQPPPDDAPKQVGNVLEKLGSFYGH